MADDLDIVRKIFEHRLRQDDLDQILSSLSIADRDQLVQKIGVLLRQISALVEVSNKVSDSLSLDILLPRMIEIITEALHADRSSMFLFDAENDELFSRIAQGDSVGEIRFPSHMGIAGSVFKTGEMVIIPDAYKDPRFNPEVDKKTGYRTRNILCAPIKNRKQEVIGVTQALNKHAGGFNREDLALLEALTSQAAAALENAYMYEKMERARREESQLLELTSAISSELKLDILLMKIVNFTTEMLDADRSSLFMYDPKTEELWSKVAEGAEIKEIRFPASAGIAGACFSAGEVLNIPDAYEDPRFNPEVDKKTGYRTNSILCMPILTKEGRKLGVMQVLNKREGPFGALDEKRLRAFAAQASIALENAQLFEDVLNARNYNESILKSLSNGVVTLNADRQIIKINDAARRILGFADEEVVFRELESVFGKDNPWILDSVGRVAETSEVDLALDTDVVISDGEKISVNLTVVPLIDIKEEPIGFMLIFEDISREKRVKSTMARYMTKEVMDKLLEGGESVLGGTAQEVTVLFSDIRSFTTISEELGARETVSMLNDYFSHMIEVIFEHQGILDKYIGDAIMALFGTPFKTPEDTDNAVIVANQMMVALGEINRRRAAQNKAPIEIGVGISTGEVVAGNIGSPKRMDYTVIGDSVNLAARLEGANKYYGTKILVCETCVRSLKNPTRLREIDLIRVKGKIRPVAVYEALDHHTDRTFPNMDRALLAFEKGLKHYRNCEWSRGVACFEDALNLSPNDYPSRLYLDRCRHYLDDPPGDSWDGVCTMTHK